MNMPYLECPKCKSYRPKEDNSPEKCRCGSQWNETDWYTINPTAAVSWYKRYNEEDGY